MAKYCVECKDRPARYWGSNFCEECFKELLREKIKEDDLLRTESQNSR